MPNIPNSWIGRSTARVTADGGEPGGLDERDGRTSAHSDPERAASDEAVAAAVAAVTEDDLDPAESGSFALSGESGTDAHGRGESDGGDRADGTVVVTSSGTTDDRTDVGGEDDPLETVDDSGSDVDERTSGPAADSGPDDHSGPHDDSGPDGGVVLRAEGLEKTYGSRLPFGRAVEVLDGASVEIRAGEVVGIVGENGSGKSTLMKALVGALDPDAGTVETSGRVGWCPQEELLYDRLTVRETFRLFGEAYDMDGDEVTEARDRLADRLDFAEFLDYRVDQLSGGNRQKVNLSVALLHDPDVLLLDEPYTGFDWDTYLAFWDLTAELRERGTAVAIISHLINEQERFDRIFELADGRLSDVTEEGSSQASDAGVR